MARVDWIKLSTDIFQSRKFLILDKRKDRDSVELMWIKLLTLAAEVNDNGKIYITPGLPHSIETLAAVLARSEKEVQTALNIFLDFDMVHDDYGVISITNWDKYQNSEKLEKMREQARERKRKQRDVTQMSRSCHADVTRDKNEMSRYREDKKEEQILRLEGEGRIEGIPPDGGTAPPLPAEDKMNPLYGIGKGVVLLSENQMGKLVEDLSTAEIDHYIGVVADQITKGKTYRKSHYQAIMDMVAQDRGT